MEAGMVVFTLSILALAGMRALMYRQNTLFTALEEIPERERAIAVIGALQRREITGSDLTREQRYSLLKVQFEQRMQRMRLLTTIAVSVSVLAAALFVLLSARFSDESQKWAVGAVGTIIGYWLKA